MQNYNMNAKKEKKNNKRNIHSIAISLSNILVWSFYVQK